ncbi:MAG: polysaccharide deacetylase family protein [Defluviitaleaceae bacterium]|nr:polysaccharide deacetylase family protein [Defluviitaleaceae bacterium]
MNINFSLFAEGKPKALTMSYDDGVVQDAQLVGIFNKHEIKGAFHINGGLFGTAGDKQGRPRIPKDEIKQVYEGHEISLHGYTHQSLSVTPNLRIAEEIIKDKLELESITGEPVRGMSYPNGAVNDTVVELLTQMGVEYCRKVETTESFDIPNDFLRWEGTTHHKRRLLELGESFLDNSNSRGWRARLMHVWGHSFEFDENNNWDLIEKFCSMVGGKEDIWYATNIEIVDYLKTLRNLKFTADQKTVLNQSMIDVWIQVDGEPVKIPGGGITKIG